MCQYCIWHKQMVTHKRQSRIKGARGVQGKLSTASTLSLHETTSTTKCVASRWDNLGFIGCRFIISTKESVYQTDTARAASPFSPPSAAERHGFSSRKDLLQHLLDSIMKNMLIISQVVNVNNKHVIRTNRIRIRRHHQGDRCGGVCSSSCHSCLP